MNDNNGVSNNQSVTNENIGTQDAVVLGELRKDKIGRPILVVELFFVFIIVLIALPIVTKMMDNENSFLYKLFNKDETITVTPTDEEEEFLDGSENQQLISSTVMKYENIVVGNFSLGSDYIYCIIYSYNGELNLDEEAYYLEVRSSSSSNLIAAVKLTGTYDNQQETVTLKAYGLSFNSNYSYVGKIVEMTDNDYPDVSLTSDESGLSTLTCSLDNRVLEYTFKNKYLINIEDTQDVYLSEQKDSTTYLNLKSTYEEKALKLGSDVASVEEGSSGFTYHADINLERMSVPSSISDYNYFELDTEAKIVSYTLKGKGFDCK